MNKNILSIIALIGILVGGAGCAPYNERIGTVSITGCTILLDTPCPDDEGNYKVELNLDDWTLTPACITAKKNKVVSVHITSSETIEKGTVWVFPKNLDNLFWLAKSNDPNKNKIDITVKEKKPSGKDLPAGTYSYGIWTEDKCIDPRVRVIN
jgi:hypothetical protein